MQPLVKCACPKCGCVAFEPESYLQSRPELTCIPECGHTAAIDEWIIAGAYSRRRPNFWVGLSASMVLTRRLAEEAIKRRLNRYRFYYSGGLRF
jgi:hypothetical protein